MNKLTRSFLVRDFDRDFGMGLLLLPEDAAHQVDGHLADVDGVVDQVLDEDGGHLGRKRVVAASQQADHGHAEVVVAPVQLT